jgi:diguanylate cyclase (GGDEF)-like protein
MRLPGRQDALLVAGVAAALVILFSAPIARVLDFARGLEQQTGLSLVPALVVLTIVVFFHQVRHKHEMQARAAAAEAARLEAEQRAHELERLVAFGHALARALDHDSIRLAVSHHLPKLAGTDDIWVLLRQGPDWEALAGDTRGAADVLQREDLAERLLGGAEATGASLRSMGFPLVVGGTAMGVLGVECGDTPLTPARQRAVEAAAALLAVSLKNAQLFREVRENSVKDSLTGCVTRNHATEVIDAELRRARRSQMPVSVIMFDLDHFKGINARHGHLCGDAVLATIGRRMREVLRGSDLKCRYGGEEFLVLLPETPLAGARRVAETLRREIAEQPVAWGGESFGVTASFGITQALPNEISIQAIVARADAALYRAKQDGRNCVCVAADVLAFVEARKAHIM